MSVYCLLLNLHEEIVRQPRICLFALGRGRNQLVHELEAVFIRNLLEIANREELLHISINLLGGRF